MDLTQNMQDTLDRYNELLEDNNFDEFFKNIYWRNRAPYIEFFMIDLDINILEDMTTIPERFFNDCNFLTEITIPGNIQVIGESAFAGCENLQKVICEDGIKKVEKAAFAECPKLQVVKLPEGPTVIYRNTFQDDTALKQVFIPNSVVDLQYAAFIGCNQEGKFIIANWRDNEADQLTIKENEIPFYKAHLKFAD